MNEDNKMDCWAIYSDKIVLENEVFDEYMIVENEKMFQIQKEKPSPDFPIMDMDHLGLVAMAGLVDSHVHINESGRTEWEGFITPIFEDNWYTIMELQLGVPKDVPFYLGGKSDKKTKYVWQCHRSTI